ncbi:glucooligosaccharide oxidase [Dendrothele bispora CBS 962.96]|uniref:Glucooligosaccharide oxidase n=1 Tax=Dendrothele bispora (strain CBS 962.96) TaxID=1314807 RepID=A0A4S8MT58_DENBC|nr:glucooligosaccharide oxidase [Dendrothele bispora CBS 962.96]
MTSCQGTNTTSFKTALGDVRTVFPGDADYPAASASYNLRFEVNPFAIAFPTDTQQVSIAIKAGAENNLRVVARSGGHSYIANSLGGKNGSFVVDLSQLKAITIDPVTFNADIETGNRLGDIDLALNEQGRGLPHGRCSFVGIGGHSGEFGGWGFPSRMWGLTLDNILSATVVLANGTVVTASEESHSDLFWGIRGASPSFGIVTSIKFHTHPIPSGGTHFALFWDMDIATATSTFASFQSFALSPSLPTTFGGEIGVLKGSAHGRVTILFFGSYFGSSDQAEFNRTVEPFLSGLPEPDVHLGSMLVSGTWVEVLEAAALPTGNLSTIGRKDSNDTFYAKSLMTPQDVPLTMEAIGDMMEYLGTTGFESDLFWAVEIELYGGVDSAVNAVPLNSTAFGHRNTLFTFQLYTSTLNSLPPFPNEAFGLVDGIVTSITSNMPDDWNFGAYPNYIDDRLQDWQRLYYGEHYSRLEKLKGSLDPSDVFQFPISIEEPDTPYIYF